VTPGPEPSSGKRSIAATSSEITIAANDAHAQTVAPTVISSSTISTYGRDSAGNAPVTSWRISPTDIAAVTLARTLADASRRSRAMIPAASKRSSGIPACRRTPACAAPVRSPFRLATPLSMSAPKRAENWASNSPDRSRPSSARSEPVSHARAAALPCAHWSVGVSELTSKMLSSLATGSPLRWRSYPLRCLRIGWPS
jgi:hypothetical protein